MNGKSEGVAFIRIKCPACAGSGKKKSIPPATASWPLGWRWVRNVRTGPTLPVPDAWPGPDVSVMIL